MVPKKRSYSQERPNPKKRSADPSPGTIEAKKACIMRRPGDKRELDKYCWICHEPGQDINCYLCTRAYHDECLIRTSGEFTPLQVCPECQLKSLDGIEPCKYLNVEKLKVILHSVTLRVFRTKREKNEMLLAWPTDLGIEELAKIIDFGILLDNLNEKIHYTKVVEYYSDIKYMYHNCVIMFGANSEQARAAEQMRRLFKKELLDVEACHDCYYRLYCDIPNNRYPFVRLCDPPHDIVWAQLTGHPFWPAKCIKVAKGIAHVRYFGEHEVSDLPLNKLFHISKSHPKFKDSDIFSESNSGPKSHYFKTAVKELGNYIKLHTMKFGKFQFYPHRTRYPQKSQPDSDEVEAVANEGLEENQLSVGTQKGIQLKMEGNVQDEGSTTVELIEGCQVNTGEVNAGEVNAGQVNGCQDTAMQEENRETQDIRQGDPNMSTVTSVDMTFSTEPCASSPIASGIGSISTDSPSTSNTHQLPKGSIIGIDKIFGSTDVQRIRAFETTRSNNASNENLLNPSVSGSSSGGSQTPMAEKDGEHNPVRMDEICTENSNASTETISNPPESLDEEDDVIILDPPSKNDSEENRLFDPTMLLPYILDQQPHSKYLFEETLYVTKAIFLRYWAQFQNCPSAPQRISKAIGNWRKYEVLYHKSEKEKKQLQVQLKEITEDYDKIQKGLEELKTQHSDLKKDKMALENLNDSIRTIIVHLQRNITLHEQSWTDKYKNKEEILEETKKELDLLKAENEKFREKQLSYIKETDLLKAENEKFQARHLSQMKERDLLKDEIEKLRVQRSSKKEIDLLKAEIQKLKAQHLCNTKDRDFYKTKTEKYKALHSSHMIEKDFYKKEIAKYKEQLTSDKILSYLVNDYCIVCQQPASLRCCSNHNYCSASCKSLDTSKHDNYCSNKIMNPSNGGLPSIDQLGILGQGVTIQRRSRTVTNIQIERIIKRRSSQEASTTEEKLNIPSTSREMITESSSDSDQTETEDEFSSEEEESETEEDEAETEEDEAEIEEELDQAETEEKHILSSPTSPTLESFTQSIRSSTRCYGSERMQNIRYQQ